MSAHRGGFYEGLVSRPVGTFVIFTTLIVIGLIAYARIPLQMLPSGMTATRYGVWVETPGASAAENEEKVARVLEEHFRTLPDIQSEELYSSSDDGGVYVRVSFNGDADLELAKAELRDRVERARPQLPDSVEEIHVWGNDEGDPPIMFFAVLVDERTADSDWLIENRVQRRLEAVDGVSRAQVWGLLDDSVRILLDEERVKQSRLDLGALVRRLSADNFAQPLGEIDDGGRRFLLRSDMRFDDLEAVGRFPIGQGLRLSDVARVERVKTVRDHLTRIDGRDAYYGMLQKESTANVVEVAGRLHEALDGLARDPALSRVSVEVFFDQAAFIEESLHQLQSTALWGGGLAIAVLFAFLRRVRMTLCVALSIPVSALLAVAWESFTGGSFNVLTMTGLTLGIGMLVDNSVVVIENVARLHQAGASPRKAAVAGVRDVALAIALATSTTVVVFLPLIFISDHPQMRAILAALGRPLCVSLAFSLLAALVFLPVASARVLGSRPRWVERLGRAARPLEEWPVRALAHGVGLGRRLAHAGLVVLHRLERALLAVLVPLRFGIAAALVAAIAVRARDFAGLHSLARELDVVGVSSASTRGAASTILAGSLLALIAAGLAVVGLPRWRRRASAAPAPPAAFAPGGTSVLGWLQNANRALLGWTLSHRMLATLLAFGAFATITIPTGRMTLAAFGQEEDGSELDVDIDLEANFTLAETSAEFERYEELLERYREPWGFAHLVSRFGAGGGEIELRWSERQDPSLLQSRREELRRVLPRRAGHRLRLSRDQEVGDMSRQFASFQLRGPSAELLEQYGQRAVEILRGVPGLLDVTSSLESSPEQVRLVFDDEAAHSYGVSADLALQNVSWALRGAMLPRFQDEGREVPFLIEYDAEELAGLDTLRDLEVFTGEDVVPLASFTEIAFQRGSREIERRNGHTTFDIQARLGDPNRQTELVSAGYAALEALDLPRGFSLGLDTSALARQQEEFAEMKKALLLSVVLVFLLMGILFESLLLPISVLSTIPFAALGALWTLYLTGTTMDSVGWIGIILLVGVVVNNGIVLIDKIHRLRVRDGLPRREAVLEGSAARVRPILMTALTTVFGLLPMALGPAAREGIDYRALATCVAGGLTLSTFFTLWVVPLAYTAADDLARTLHWLVRRALHRGPAPQEAPGFSP